ncbi:hypothetical protein HYX12_01240, partial [Candidatus Woesearchaeota archaeon]|nr:hypothetical protein [Candidatus Woesearchaeota archaeon]
KKLETKLDRFSSDLNSTQNKEIDLRNEISELMKKEAYLNQKKTSTKDKIATLIKKIEKITSVERQLQE